MSYILLVEWLLYIYIYQTLSLSLYIYIYIYISYVKTQKFKNVLNIHILRLHVVKRKRCASYVCIYPIQPPQTGCDTRSIFSGVQLVWIKSFLSPRLVTVPRWKNSVCPNISQSTKRDTHFFSVRTSTA